MTEQNIIWTCDICQMPVAGADADGYLTICTRDLNTWHEANRQHVERRPAGPGEAVGLDYILDGPKSVQWHVYHDTCDPRPDDNSYAFAVNRADTTGKLLDWTFHIQGKGWLDITDWREFITRRVLRPLNINA